MKKQLLYLLFPFYFFLVSLCIPLHAYLSSSVRDKVEQARKNSNPIKRNNLQELFKNVVKSDPHDELAAFYDQLNALEWANQTVLVKTLTDFQQESKSQALACLKKHIDKSFEQEKYPLVAFVCKLQCEYDFVQKSTTTLFSMINKRDGNDGLSIQQGLELIHTLKNNLELFLTLVNDALI